VITTRRYLALTAYALTVAFTCAYLGSGHGPGPIVVIPFALLLVVVAASRPVIWIPATLIGGAAITFAHGAGNGWSLAVLVFGASWAVLTFAFAAGLVVRRRFVAETEARAEWTQRSREEEARRRMAEERLQIAREMHDVVGHSLAVISLQAGVAEHLLESRPEQVRAAIIAIRQVSKQALTELRDELAMLRGSGDGSVERAPTPGLDALPALIARMREAGMPVHLDVDGDASNVPDFVGSAAYRIVQESLTNVVRHAANAETTVSARVGTDRVEVEVVDRGPGLRNGASLGDGIAGMRDRAGALGGNFSAGNRTDGGFRVWAALPLHPT
jgi:signal transduction histidine kinase